MTDREILQKAIDKVVNRGYLPKEYLPIAEKSGLADGLIENGMVEKLIFSHDFAKAFFGEEIIEKPWKWVISTEIINKKSNNSWTIEEFENIYPEMFDLLKNTEKEFITTENFWYIKSRDYILKNKGWQYYLQEMVLVEDKLQYLKQFIDE